ncbi:MAG: TlpA disulfide reductase family protein [Solirubrobacteraceae bacterium]
MIRRCFLLLAVPALLLLAACGSSAETGAAGPKSATTPRFIDGGVPAFQARLASLRGRPVVVNQWASWCGPCRYEFPFFAASAKKYRGRVAFLGVDSRDSREDAEAFVRDNPVPYEHFFDPEAEIARTFRGGRAWPTTAFYSSDGELVFTRAGGYADQEQLDAEIEKYALG